ncbi:MAG: chromosome partitioning protein [Patescibacteria group bacterium]|nr:chromosome partitioning protein [Patescibacteria group bacterium]
MNFDWILDRVEDDSKASKMYNKRRRLEGKLKVVQIIAVTNQKGGVGKTTTTINVAYNLAKEGKRVLLVDLDPQGNATSGLSVSKSSATTRDVLSKKVELSKAVQKTAYKNLAVLPTDAELATLETEIATAKDRAIRLKQVLVDAQYDVVLIDCPPSLGLLTVNALTAANSVIIPVQTEYYALEGLGQLLETMKLVRQALNPRLAILGVVMTMHNARTTLSAQVEEQLKKHFKERLFETVVPRNIRVAEAPSHGKPVGEFDKWSKGARAYKALSKEVMERL